MDPDLFKEVEDLIRTTNIPNVTYQGTPKGRRITFGYVPPMMRYVHEPKPSAQNKNHPALYRALLKLGNAICPFPYDAITVNKNNVCRPHVDKNNLGASLIVTGGDYEGGSFMLEGNPIETRYTPVCFDGSRLHWNEPFTGYRWSIVFFKLEVLPKFLPLFKADVNDPNRVWSMLDMPSPAV